MGLIYKTIDELVVRIDERNMSNEDIPLVGLSIDKCFIPSVANTIGTDLSKYKRIYKKDFAVSLMQVSRDSKIPIACLKEYDIAIMSPAYSIFRVRNERVVLPGYLEMWFKRSEFDREAAFIAVGGVRGSMPWDEFAMMKVAVPDIVWQKSIIKAYKSITDRIDLKKKINDNLELQAKTYFNAVFCDFDKSVDVEETTKSKLPNDWCFAKVGDYCNENIENLSKSDQYATILYLDTGSITQNYINQLQELNISEDEMPSRAKRKVFDGDIVYSTVRPNLRHYGLIQNPPDNFIASTGFAVLHNNGKSVSNELLYMWLTKDSVLEYLQAVAENSVSTYPSLNVADLLDVRIIVPDENTLSNVNRILQTIFKAIYENNLQIKLLENSKSVLLPKLLLSY